MASTVEFLEELVQSAPDGIVVVDEGPRVVFTNRQVETLFQYSSSELLGESLEILIPEQARAAHRSHMLRFLAQPAARMMGSGLTLAGRRKDGTEFPVEIAISPILAVSGRFAVAIVRDVSARVALEAARDRLIQDVARRDERVRVARQLQDTVIQFSYGAGLLLSEAGARLTDAPPEVRQLLAEAERTLRELIPQVRSVIASLDRSAEAGSADSSAASSE